MTDDQYLGQASTPTPPEPPQPPPLPMEPQADAPKSKAWIWILAAVAIVALVGAWYLLTATPQVAVPNVVGMAQEDAKAALTLAGLTVGQTSEEATVAVEPGTVTEQSPRPLVEVDEGSRVDLVVAAIPMAVVPDVVGESQEVAATKLAQEGLRVGATEYVYDKNADAGFVVSQDPAAGDEVVIASEVSLTISKGEQTGEVPNVVGLSQDDAIAALEAAGFKVETEKAHSESVEAGDVISQSPEAGKSVAAGSVVTITVSTGAPAPAAPAEPKPEEPAAPSDPKPEEPAPEQPAPEEPGPGTPEDELVTVPDVVGQGIVQSIIEIKMAKLKVKIGWVADDANVFKVSAQKPPAGEKVDPGTTVTIEIGLPAFLFDLELPSEFPTATPQPLPAPVQPESTEPSGAAGG